MIKTIHDQDTYDIFDMFYDNPDRQKDAKFLGRFRVIQQIEEEDFYNDLFIGINVDTEQLCLVRGSEVCGYGGGTCYEVFPLKGIRVLND